MLWNFGLPPETLYPERNNTREGDHSIEVTGAALGTGGFVAIIRTGESTVMLPVISGFF